ncbi:LamB/YcsF family protein [Verticiella sediminum]
MGESFGAWTMGDDEAAIVHVDQANLACGFHASDPVTMARTVALAARHGVSIGAHPAYPDLVGFGRRHMACAAHEIQAIVMYQVGALQAFCRAHGTQVDYVKPHGALYNDMARDDAVFGAVLRACASLGGLPLMTGACADNARERSLAQAAGVPLLFEAFADRAYRNGGEMVPRSVAGAVHHDPERIFAQGLAIARGEAFDGLDGEPVRLEAHTLCVHGDNAESLAVVARLRRALEAL